MIEVHDAGRPNVVRVRITGRLTRRDYEVMYRHLSEKTAEHGHVCLLIEAVAFGVTGLVSMWHGIVPDIRYRNRIKLDRVAVLGEDLGARVSTVMWRKLNPVWPLHAHHIRYFGADDRDRARAWVDGGRDDGLTTDESP